MARQARAKGSSTEALLLLAAWASGTSATQALGRAGAGGSGGQVALEVDLPEGSGRTGPSWPRPRVYRGWAFPYNFTATTSPTHKDPHPPPATGVEHMYPTGTVNFLPTASNSVVGAEQRTAEYLRRGVLPLGWGYCWDDPWIPHNGSAITNQSAAIERFATYARGTDITAGVGLDECNRDNAHFTGENELAAAGFRKGRRPGHTIAGWGANAGDGMPSSTLAMRQSTPGARRR